MIIKNIKFKDNSTIEKVAKLSLVENKGKEEIIQNLLSDFPDESVEVIRKKVNDYLWHINKKLEKINTNIIEQTGENQADDTALIIDIREKRNGLYLYIKTNEIYENFLKSKKELRVSTNLWNQRKTGEFYYGNLITRPEFDDINREIILLNSINYGILRIKGISQGLEFPITQIVSEDRLIQLLEKFSTDFISFYNKNILKQKTHIRLVVGVNDENN